MGEKRMNKFNELIKIKHIKERHRLAILYYLSGYGLIEVAKIFGSINNFIKDCESLYGRNSAPPLIKKIRRIQIETDQLDESYLNSNHKEIVTKFIDDFFTYEYPKF